MLHLIGWALFGVNFRPLQEIEAIMGDGRIFDTGPFFARLWYIYGIAAFRGLTGNKKLGYMFIIK